MEFLQVTVLFIARGGTKWFLFPWGALQKLFEKHCTKRRYENIYHCVRHC